MAPKHSSEGLGGDSSSPVPTSSSTGSTGSSTSKVPLGDNSASQDIVNAARGRSDGFEIGGDRAIGSPPNWASQDSEKLHSMAVDDNEPGTAVAIGHAWSHHGRELSQASNDLYAAISELGAVWVGEGAASAQGALVAIANSGSQASEAAHTMADRLAKQASAAEKVKNMPKGQKHDPAQGVAGALAGGPAALVVDQKGPADAAGDVKAVQVRFFNEYTKAMSEVDSSTPSFGPESLGMKPTATHNSVGGFGNVGGINATTVGHGISGSGTSFGSHAAGGSGGPGGPAGHVPDSGTFATSGYTGGNALASGAGVGVGGAPAAPATPAVPTGGSTGSGVGQALGLGALGGGLGLAGGRALSQGSKSGAKSESDTSAAAAENQGAGQSAASAGAPQQGVVSSAGTIGGQATPPGMNPMGGMGGMGGAHGAHAEQDEEHTHASFLIEPDPDDTFGANEATPPPVIGAWSDEDDR
ncbi:hypothetical protein ACFWY9_22590 [Amycolatopsis sp. NPDC059027]|uniref:hypothetical protein n=1 Tax=Amycolatopsis sp. NPDC059027 TaxID=3346709 RepID=UPI00366B950D